ncbi:hypothetical protein COLO4_26681 [Corchorus olitorius]|uniref:Tudor domain-containing protein n=1 Tax=Corchorus olitorius TaxID=93759 RepID=A0A1R3HV40_9ROSI|nr:hypothetical protein COLO4_26681 [Corchorus olitorius]
MELEKQLKEAGSSLLSPPSSIDELFNLLDKVENLLIRVDQAPPRSMQKALLPVMKALISDALLRNSDMDVKVSVACCIIELTRISAPEAPYNDDLMKEIFQLTVAAFENLSLVSSRCYVKAVSILDTFARVRLCLVMLDLECDELIIEMFQQFLKKIRSNHPHTVFLAMESIMTLVLDETEDISWGLLSPLLASVRKENQKILPISWKLGENVIANCSYKIKPYLMEAVQSRDIALDEYSPIIASVCKSESDTLNKSGDHLVTVDPVFRGERCQAVDAISKSLMRNLTASIRDNNRNNDSFLNIKPSKILERDLEVTRSADAVDGAALENFVTVETEPDTASKKRGRRPSSMMGTEEGYDHSWNSTDLEKPSCQVNGIIGASSASPNSGFPGGCHLRKDQTKRKESMTTENADPNPSKKLKSKAEKHTPSKDASLKMKSDAKPSERKQQNRSRRVEIDAKTAQASLYFVPKKEARVQGDLEEKELQQETLKQYIHKRTLVHDAMLDKSITGASDSLKTISGSVSTARRGGSSLEKTPKTNPKRQRNAGNNMASELPALGEELIGRKIKVWWPMDRAFYNGVVDFYDPIRMKHRVLYEDGDEELLNLRRERWQLIHDKGQENDVLTPDVSLDILSEQKGKTHISSPKSAEPHSFSNSASTWKPKSSGDKFPDGGILGKPIVHESAKDACMTDSRSSGDGKKLADDFKVETNSSESERTISENRPSSDNTSVKDGESPSAMACVTQGSEGKETSV